MYRERYWNDALFEAIEHLEKTLADVYGDRVKVTVTEASLR